VSVCSGHCDHGSRSGKPPGAGEKNFEVSREGRERELLLAGTRRRGFDFMGISAGKKYEVISSVFLDK
jgi:hypothetical protein